MEYTIYNPFVPRTTLIRFPNSVFEVRLNIPGVASNVDIVPHDNYIIVTGSLHPRVKKDTEEKPSTLIWTDQPCGFFGRDVPVNLAPGTELVVLNTHQELDDYIIRFTIRNSKVSRAQFGCADIANSVHDVTTRPTCSTAATVNYTQYPYSVTGCPRVSFNHIPYGPGGVIHGPIPSSCGKIAKGGCC